MTQKYKQLITRTHQLKMQVQSRGRSRWLAPCTAPTAFLAGIQIVSSQQLVASSQQQERKRNASDCDHQRALALTNNLYTVLGFNYTIFWLKRVFYVLICSFAQKVCFLCAGHSRACRQNGLKTLINRRLGVVNPLVFLF